MELQTFILNIGVSQIAQRLGVSKSTVSNWKLLKAAPQPMHAHELIKLSVGLLTYETIYKPFVKAQLKLKS